jgi:hypothetical protein
VSDQKIRTAAKKAALALIPWRFLLGVARVFMYGAKKYAPGNWYNATLEDGAGERYVSAAQRHLSEMQHPSGLFTPESLAARDEESGYPHIDHAICGLIMLRGIMVKCGALPADPGHVPPFALGSVTVHIRVDADDIEAPEPSVADVRLAALDKPWAPPTDPVADLKAAADARYEALIAHRVEKGAYDVSAEAAAAPPPKPVLSAAQRTVLDILDDGRTWSWSALCCHRGTMTIDELKTAVDSLAAAGVIRGDYAGFSLGGGKTP